MEVSFDREYDIVGVCFVEGPDAHTVAIDEFRSVEYSSSGEVMGVEFENASQGVTLAGLPVDVVAVANALKDAGVPVRDVTLASQP